MTPLVTLCSSGLEGMVAPELGGKTLSVRNRSSGHELLFQRIGVQPTARSEFGDWAFGWDDCWPSVAAGGPGYPDHGALWSQSARISEKSESRLTLETVPRDRSWYYAKTWTLIEDTIEVSVSVENLSTLPLPSFWTLHALIRLEDDMQLVFPSGDSRKTVSGNDFSPRSFPSWGTASKFWVPGPVERGFCGVDYPTLGMAYRLQWNPAELPFLGYWATNGGFRGERNAAWEPSDGYYDSIQTAEDNGCLPILAPGGAKTLTLRMTWKRK